MSETVRLLAVKQFEHFNLQLDTELLELITMASEICGTAVALISLLDDETQWIKVRKGTDKESIPRASTYCNHTIHHTDLLIVPDALVDGRFATNPMVLDDAVIRFYAGAPLINRDGLRLGTLCVMDQKPHTPDKHQELMLKMLSKQAINIMELKLSYELLKKNEKEVEEQKQTIRNAEIRLRSFFESSPNFHVLLGRKGEILDYNKSAYNFIRRIHATKVVRGDLFTTYLAPSFVETFTEKYNLALAGEKGYAEGYTDYGEHGEIWWEANFEPAWNNDNDVIGVSYSIRNVTERKIYEQKIIAQNQSLINIAYIQSHEYRGPLTSIMGMMNLIKAEDYQPPVEYLQLLEIAINKLDEKIHETVTHVNMHELSDKNLLKLF